LAVGHALGINTYFAPLADVLDLCFSILSVPRPTYAKIDPVAAAVLLAVDRNTRLRPDPSFETFATDRLLNITKECMLRAAEKVGCYVRVRRRASSLCETLALKRVQARLITNGL
jgi:hypothetical protein